MSDLILPSAVVALAHKRLREAAAGLRNKVTATRYDARTGLLVRGASTDAVVVQPTDRRVLALLEGGRDLLAGKRQAGLPPNLRIGTGVGKFAVLGTAGFELPSYAEHFTGNPLWRAGALRRGSPDPNLSQVIVPATEFAIQVGRLGRQKTTDQDEQREIDAFAGGMLVAAATSVLVGPFGRGLRADQSTMRHDRFGPAAMGLASQQAIANLLGGPAGFGSWQSWWPREGDVPSALYDGYLDALNQTYGFLSTPSGFGPFLQGFEPGEDLSAKRLAAGVSFLTQDLVTASWGAGAWYLVLSPALLSVPVTLLVARFLSPSSGFVTEGSSPGALGGLQLYSLAAGISSISPFLLSMYLWSQVPQHVEAFVTALVLGIARFGLTPATVVAAAAGDTTATWVLWSLLAGTDLYALIRGIVALGTGRAGDAFVHLVGATPFVFGLTALAFAAIMDALDLTSDLAFWLTWAILTVLILVPGGLAAAFALAGSGGIGALFAPERSGRLPIIEALNAAAGATGVTRPAVFDESTLWRDPAIAADLAAALTELRYPTDAQPLVKVWWTTPGSALEIAHDDHTIRLRVDGGAPTVVALGPHELTGLAISIKLEDALPGVATALVDPALDQRLAFPSALSDPGDGLPSHAEHDAHAGDFMPVGTSEEDAYLLATAPRAAVATRVALAAAAGEAAASPRVIPDPSLADLEDSALGLAADLAAILVAGAVPSLRGATANTPGLPPIANPVPAPVYQVFRQWNLDERRLNEWRMLVDGGAVSEKVNPALHDPGMRPHPNAAAYASAAPSGEDLLNDMGWIRTWRAWLRVATDVTTDTSATTAEPYTPPVQRRDGRTARPTNRELTEAIRFLFDLL